MKKFLALFTLLLISCKTAPVYEPTIETSFLDTDVYCADESCWDCTKKLYSDGEEVDLGFDMHCHTSLWNSMNTLDTRYAYWEDYDLKLFDYAMQSSEEMMSLREDTEGASIFWAPSGDRFAVVAMNWNYEGDKTKVFILDLDHKGRLVDKQTHTLKVRYGCHDAGCNVLDGFFWFEDDYTIKYQTFADDPYDDESSSLETFDL